MPDFVEVPDLSSNAFSVFVGQRGVRDLQRFLTAVGDAGEIPDHDRLLKLVKTGIAQFGDRAVRDMEASEGVATARLIPWTEALAGLPEWAIAGAFTRCNQATHPPRPVEVKETAKKAAEGLPWFIIRARAILRHVQQTRPEWLEDN
jgi:hypothetical protein